MATEAGVPVTLAVIDGGSRTVMMNEEFIPSGDIDADMAAIKRYYSQFTAIYPEKFSTETE